MSDPIKPVIGPKNGPFLVADIVDPALYPLLYHNQQNLEKIARVKKSRRWYAPWRYFYYWHLVTCHAAWIGCCYSHLERELHDYQSRT